MVYRAIDSDTVVSGMLSTSESRRVGSSVVPYDTLASAHSDRVSLTPTRPSTAGAATSSLDDANCAKVPPLAVPSVASMSPSAAPPTQRTPPPTSTRAVASGAWALANPGAASVEEHPEPRTREPRTEAHLEP